jgi:hypothetical protein
MDDIEQVCAEDIYSSPHPAMTWLDKMQLFTWLHYGQIMTAIELLY